MSNPLSHVGQSPHPEAPKDLQQQCEQAQSQSQSQPQQPEPPPAPAERPATHLPQHPQQMDDISQKPAEQQQGGQPGGSPAPGSAIPASTDTD